MNLRGKTFVAPVGEEKVDLSVWGAIPYYVSPLVLGSDALLLTFKGESLFKERDITPFQRSMFQLYVIFGLLPMADLLVGADWKNPTKEQLRNHKNQFIFRLPLYLWCVAEFIMTTAVFKTIFNKDSKLRFRDKLSLFFMIGLLNGAFGINVSHELIHKNSFLEKWLGHLLLCNVNYSHWGNEHLDGHHTHVATPLDPATATFGQSLFTFLPQTYIGSFKSSVELERKRLQVLQKKEKIEDVNFYTTDNSIIRGSLTTFAFSLALAKYVKDWRAIPAFYAQGTIASLLLEVINYLEHYGLERKVIGKDEATGNDVYEPVNPTHSWNAPHKLTNTVLFKLQRHSHHHSIASHSYEILRNFVESPQLPTGNAGMFFLSWFPPAYKYIMDDILAAHKLEFQEENGKEKNKDEVARLKRLATVKIWVWTSAWFLLSSKLVVKVLRYD